MDRGIGVVGVVVNEETPVKSENAVKDLNCSRGTCTSLEPLKNKQ